MLFPSLFLACTANCTPEHKIPFSFIQADSVIEVVAYVEHFSEKTKDAEFVSSACTGICTSKNMLRQNIHGY